MATPTTKTNGSDTATHQFNLEDYLDLKHLPEAPQYDMQKFHTQAYAMMKMTKVEIITPEVAKAYLKHNTRNRNPLRARFHQYADDMTHNRWQLNGDTIRFDVDGTLLDGQNRLLACIKSGIPFVTLVVRNLPREAQDVMDIGAPRSAYQIATIHGIQNANLASGIARLVVWYEDHSHSFSSTAQPSKPEVVDWITRHTPDGELARLCSIAVEVSNKNLGSPSIAGFCLYVFSKIDAEKACLFFRELIEGGMSNTQPTFHLREKLLRAAAGRNKPTRFELMAYYIKAWNHYIRGRQLGRLLYLQSETFPEVLKPLPASVEA